MCSEICGHITNARIIQRFGVGQRVLGSVRACGEFESGCFQNGADESALKANFSITKIFPWFIVGFVAMSVIASVFPVSASVVAGTKTASKFLMVASLGAIGLNTSFASMKKSGIRPMIHGFIISALVVVVALAVEIAMGIV